MKKLRAGGVRFLFFRVGNKLSPKDIEDFKKENQHVKLRMFEKPYLHDRYILGKDKMLIIGHGLNLRDKETFMILLDDTVAKDLRDSLLEVFNRRWKESKPI